MVDDVLEVSCDLVDLTEVSLDELRRTTDRSVEASVHAVLLSVTDPAVRAARMSSSGSDCSGGLLPEWPERKTMPLITC
ncbi:hypothetical protein ADL03_07345 [Nocardia sp. NRRL S-836]|nr:hypothetical protein ADL03_07345 [Nocardia sp. NRRL S-836]